MGMPIDLPPLPSPTFRPTHSAKPSLSTAPDHQRTSSSPQTSPLPLDHAMSPALVLVRQQHLQDNRPPLSSLAYDLPPPAVWRSSPFAGSPPAVDSMSYFTPSSSSVSVVRGTIDATTIASTTSTADSGGSLGSGSPPAMRTRPHPSLRRINRMPAFVASRTTVGGGRPSSADHSAAVTAAVHAALSSPNMEAHSLVHQLSRSLPPPPQYSPQTPQDAPTDYSLPQQQQGQAQEQATWNVRLVNTNHADNRGRMDVRSLLNSAGGHGQYYDELNRQLYYLEQAHSSLPSGAEGQRTGVITGNNDESDLAVQRQFWDRVHSQRRPSQAHGREHGREHGSGQGRGREHPREHAQETTSTRRQRAMEGVMVDSLDASSSVRPSLSSSTSSSSVSSPSPTSTSSTRSPAVSNPHSLLPMEAIPSFLQDYSAGGRTLIRADAFQPGVIHIYPENHAPIRMYGRPILSTSPSSSLSSGTSDPARHQLEAQDIVSDTTIASQTHSPSAAAVPLLSTSALPRMPSASLSPNSTSGELFRFTSTPSSPIPMRTSHQPVQGSYELSEGQTMEGASSLSDYTRMSVYATTASAQASTLDHARGPVQAAEAAEQAQP